MEQTLVCVSHAVLPELGEDSFAVRTFSNGAAFCVTDGCGGLGSRRYPEHGDHTGAYIASRAAAKAFEAFAGDELPVPRSLQEGKAAQARLCAAESAVLHACEGERPAASRIVGSMQKAFPTTLCGAVTEADDAGADVCFFWSGDSRGCVLDANGLHQCTADHLRGNPDVFDSLYRDVPLSRMLSADGEASVSLRRLRVTRPCVVLTATDGVYGALPTPMEFEWLLMSTLAAAKSPQDWQRRLGRTVGKLAQDDATLVMHIVGSEPFEALQAALSERKVLLQKQFITPVRRRKTDPDYARNAWLRYKDAGYDWTEECCGGGCDWRL